MIHLLDILPIVERRIPDTSRVLPEPVCPDTLSPDTAHAIASSNLLDNTRQLADVSPLPPSLFNVTDSNLLLTIIVVLFALSVCVFFIRKYRNQQKG
jgi:hypothetical protein